MDRDTAKNLIALATSMDPIIGKMFEVVRRIEDKETKARFEKNVGDLMGIIARDFIFPIEATYPDLKPDDG